MTEPDQRSDQPPSPGPDAQRQVCPPDAAAELASILDRYMAGLQVGNAPDRQQLLAGHPELAAQLEACLAGIEFIHRATGRADAEPAHLGDFRIVREIGRGGMGVVYEAEQTSLQRRVALKVLRFGVVADCEAMERFRREAATVARLHHTNIVPIFAVGCERDVHYYAMQLIEGRSLAQVLADAQAEKKPLACEDILAWGLQAAEALAHAHQRGVIHRDIKPSNLLLDLEGVVWLTDFGLAKRVDEATLTVRGALMGTPRYMSPEQAESLERPVDHRSDLYSLGASLYELATGRPVFESPTANGVITKILSEEPQRPRQIRRDLPRDVETIILKCLAKDPAERFSSARALASDLRAALEGRPIQARRAPVRERVARYVRKQRKVLGGAAAAAAATLVLLIAAMVGWRFYSDWQLGSVVLTTEGPSLRAELLHASNDQPVGEPFGVGTGTVIRVPEGDYRLRVTGAGLMGQTFRVAVNRGETRTRPVVLDDNPLLGNEIIPYAAFTEAVEMKPGKADFIEWTGESLIRRDGATGKVVWDAARPARPWQPDRDPVVWMRRLSSFGDAKRPGRLTQPAPDLNGDGIADLVWGLKGTPSLLALSGKDGAMLWAYCVDFAPGRSVPRENDLPIGRTLGVPCVTDIDGDGTADVAAAFALFDEARRSEAVSARGIQPGLADPLGLADRCVVAAVSGRSGKVLWKQAVGFEGMPLHPAVSDRGATILRGKGKPVVVLGSARWVRLDLATGRPVGPAVDFGSLPVRPIQYADFDGDGDPELLVLLPGSRQECLSLEVFSSATGHRLWAAEVRDSYPTGQRQGWDRSWPLVMDRGGGRHADIVVPDFDERARYNGVKALDCFGGMTRWVHPMRPHSGRRDGLVHLLACPDLDGDGERDIVAVSRAGGLLERMAGAPPEKNWVYVDALSGKDGHGLWWWRCEIGNPDATPIKPPCWFGRGPDGWPLVAIALGGKPAPGDPPVNWFNPPDPPVVHLLAAATGNEAHTIAGLSWPRAADLDGDGLADLWGSADGKLRAFRGAAPEHWRALGDLHIAGDLDGDGVSDLISGDLRTRQTSSSDEKPESRTVLARSGRDGRLLWKARLDAWQDWTFLGDWTTGYSLSTFLPPGGDLDGDGAPDVLVRKEYPVFFPPGPSGKLPLVALSGRTGAFLWPGGPVPPLDFRVACYSHVQGMDVVACDGRSPGDVLLLYRTPDAGLRRKARTTRQQTRLMRLSGRDGRIVWDIVMADDQAGLMRVMESDHAFGDLDGDGALDVILRAHAPAAVGANQLELLAVSLKDGKTLWTHAFASATKPPPAFVAGDLDGDGRAEVILYSQSLSGGLTENSVELRALDGRDAAKRWTWRSAGPIFVPRRLGPGRKERISLADFEGKGRFEVCLYVDAASSPGRLVILDAQGRERAARSLPSAGPPALLLADLDGDGGDELLFQDSKEIRALRGSLEDLWTRHGSEPIRELLPARNGRAATVLLGSGVGLDAATGRPLWSGGKSQAILPGADGASLPRVIAGGDGTTICRAALPISAAGAFEPALGVAPPARSGRADPRWERPLPWVDPVAPYFHPLVQLAIAGAFVNIGIPLAILRLATRRRFWSVRLLLALPAMAAVSLAGVSMLYSILADKNGASVWDDAGAACLISLGGVPLLAYALAIGSSLLGRRWKRFSILVILTVAAAVAVGAYWLDSESRQMRADEHFTYAGWQHVVFWGAYALGVLFLLARPAKAICRFLWRLVLRILRRPARANGRLGGERGAPARRSHGLSVSTERRP